MELTPEERRKQLIIDYKITFGSEAGKRVYEDLKQFCLYDEPCFVQGSPDGTAFNLGIRNVVLRINAMKKADPDKKLQEEAISDG